MVNGLVKMALGLGLPADATHGGFFLDNIEGWYLPAPVMELTISLEIAPRLHQTAPNFHPDMQDNSLQPHI